MLEQAIASVPVTAIRRAITSLNDRRDEMTRALDNFAEWA
jgi:hypothetical protein